eukprot:1972284-Prymnesium_polylepis.1
MARVCGHGPRSFGALGGAGCCVHRGRGDGEAALRDGAALRHHALVFARGGADRGDGRCDRDARRVHQRRGGGFGCELAVRRGGVRADALRPAGARDARCLRGAEEGDDRSGGRPERADGAARRTDSSAARGVRTECGDHRVHELGGAAAGGAESRGGARHCHRGESRTGGAELVRGRRRHDDDRRAEANHHTGRGAHLGDAPLAHMASL